MKAWIKEWSSAAFAAAVWSALYVVMVVALFGLLWLVTPEVAGAVPRLAGGRLLWVWPVCWALGFFTKLSLYIFE